MITDASSSLKTGSVIYNFLPYSLSLNFLSDDDSFYSSSDSEYSDSLSSLLFVTFVGEEAYFVGLTCNCSFGSTIVVAAFINLRFYLKGDDGCFEFLVFRGIVYFSNSSRFSYSYLSCPPPKNSISIRM